MSEMEKPKKKAGWTKEQEDLIEKWKIQAEESCQKHRAICSKFTNRSTWIRLFLSIGQCMLGSAGFTSFFAQFVFDGTTDWSSLIFGTIMLANGIMNAVHDTYSWEKRSIIHDTIADRYGTLFQEIQTIGATRDLDPNACKLFVTSFSERLSDINNDAPP